MGVVDRLDINFNVQFEFLDTNLHFTWQQTSAIRNRNSKIILNGSYKVIFILVWLIRQCESDSNDKK